MEDALRQTFYCDHGHPDIQTVAADLKGDESDPVTIARRTFYFVRDRFPFGYDLYQTKASETLKRGYGVCWNKSLLLTALLRCNRIPARFGSIPLKRSFVRPAIGAWHWMANNPYHHCLVHAYLNQRWTILDTVLDKQTYESFFRPVGVAWDIDWNGRDDVHLYTESLAGPPVMHLDLDAALDQKVGNAELPKFLAVIGNRHMNKQMWKKAGIHPTGWIIDDAPVSQGSCP
ncbi:MAG: transglutaminase domain-containing protein [Deltaproteobacteria bacterium]|nr:transglutaminase domain-containing protein [Deltaproteobacteria bacterium]